MRAPRRGSLWEGQCVQGTDGRGGFPQTRGSATCSRRSLVSPWRETGDGATITRGQVCPAVGGKRGAGSTSLVCRFSKGSLFQTGACSDASGASGASAGRPCPHFYSHPRHPVPGPFLCAKRVASCRGLACLGAYLSPVPFSPAWPILSESSHFLSY